MDPDHDDRAVVSRRLLERSQVVRVEIDGVGQKAAMQLTGEVVVVARPQSPDVLGVARQVGLREGDQLGSIADRLVEGSESARQARLTIEEDGRLLDNRDTVGGPVRTRHLHAPRLRARSWGSTLPRGPARATDRTEPSSFARGIDLAGAPPGGLSARHPRGRREAPRRRPAGRPRRDRTRAARLAPDRLQFVLRLAVGWAPIWAFEYVLDAVPAAAAISARSAS